MANENGNGTASGTVGVTTDYAETDRIMDCLGMYEVRLRKLQRDYRERNGEGVDLPELLGMLIVKGETQIRHYWDAADKQAEQREIGQVLRSAGVKSKSELIALLKERGIA